MKTLLLPTRNLINLYACDKIDDKITARAKNTASSFQAVICIHWKNSGGSSLDRRCKIKGLKQSFLILVPSIAPRSDLILGVCLHGLQIMPLYTSQ